MERAENVLYRRIIGFRWSLTTERACVSMIQRERNIWILAQGIAVMGWATAMRSIHQRREGAVG